MIAHRNFLLFLSILYVCTTSHSQVKELGVGENLDAILAQFRGPVVVKFSIPGCPPCKMLARLFVSLEQEYKNEVLFVSVNGKAHMPLLKRYQIERFPTVLYFGSQTNEPRVITARTLAGLRAQISAYLGSQ